MTKTLYIGQFQHGSTSRMRAENLSNLLKGGLKVIDTNIPFSKTIPIYRSLGFRYKIGPLITLINKYVLSSLEDFQYDLIWVDKAVFLTPETTAVLRAITKKLIHFTPDPSFTFHRSRHFFNSLPYYDYLITTKSYELSYYREQTPAEKVILLHQGFDKKKHSPVHSFAQKENHMIFIGHFEKQRGEIVRHLVENKITVVVAGKGWSKFHKKKVNCAFLKYLGIGIFGDQYVQQISKAMFSWGALSKWIPEKHTTRTFEIPACGTALITERNEETQQFFSESEAIFYDSIEEMIERIRYYQNHLSELEELTRKGHEKVLSLGLDYESQLKKVLKQIL